MLDEASLKGLLTYNSFTGDFRWLPRESCPAFNGRFAGQIAGGWVKGYRTIKIDRIPYLSHRLAWLYEYGYLPEEEIDHINRIRSDNRISNLRLATHKENCHNKGVTKANTSGVRGVTRHRNRWQSQIRVDGTLIFLGTFSCKEDAISAREKAEDKYFKQAPITVLQEKHGD